ncbi:hypothetical protein GALMADRAFT_236792 [Galerina marginata CBS 339.88]|uniref:uS12 prolyl 3,4-dihydroxylase n=1 Tax=Galerina marginata (strain CBS 339.88) TaxID=685588 RepID=A0A067TYJ3_GALM3|nr:hypothetical protein GALMADRAFT_236792 [Galerina marginata CBS 339.88]
MARIRERSLSSEPAGPSSPSSVLKRMKTVHVQPSIPNDGLKTPQHFLTSPKDASAESLIVSTDPTPHFANELFDHNNIARLNSNYVESAPFKYVIVEKLFQDDLLKKVKNECLSELSFTEKETDIYKVNQTGDLASLNFLSPTQIARLPGLLALRDALYSSQFRKFLRSVTGCGPLSGKKQDMSVNSYTRGCHLLNHDDVIGTRRVSYILYMPLPHYQLWQKDWGGALELYPARINDEGQPEPESIPSKSIPPSWNQFIFFEVQPGKSFHSVEEVVVGGRGEDGRERLSISGWFHAAQEGEEGYVPELPEPTDIKSSREQLTSTSTIFKAYPMLDHEVLPDVTLSEDHIAFLSEFLNPVYLQPRTMKALSARFIEESSLELHSFLNIPLAEALEQRLRDVDTRDGLGEDRAGRIPEHISGTGIGWTIKGPPHKWRYCVLRPHEAGAPNEAVTPRHASSTDQIMRSLQDELFASVAFRAWLAIVSHLMPMRYAAEARRFRPGLDYTLATSEDSEARLDVVLGLTPPAREADSDDESDRFTQHQRGWTNTEWGGWECYMAPHNEEDDPAIYRSSSQKKSKPTTDKSNGTELVASGSKIPATVFNGATEDNGKDEEQNIEQEGLPEGEPMDEDEEEEDGTLLAVQPGFNRLLLVLRDERVMRFVKYVSAAAEGSRWDVCGEYEVGMVQETQADEESS